ncbi:MAG TPA: GNAT family N-acetyltransferase, partial [Acidimicrobiia bacterium]|nr:GNAT family N-acetyltransferase [Acidimicrobiia bacterium]
MTVVSHPMQREEEWWAVRDFLVETFPIAPPGHVWDTRRWDGHRFHRAEPSHPPWTGRTRLWREDGRIVGVAHQEGSRDLAIQIHPDRRHLEDEMVAWAEKVLAAEMPEGRVLEVPVFDYDLVRRRVLHDRGYEATDDGEVIRRMRLGDADHPAQELDGGYRIRTARAGDPVDAKVFAELLNDSFGRTFHQEAEVFAFRTGSPSYREDLDLMAEAPDGTLAASVGVTIDEVNRAGTFEPVLTHPGHRRRGLALALMREGLHRMKAAGVETAW